MRIVRTGFVLAVVLAVALPAMADRYRVEITNITKTQQFTPLAAVSHSRDIALFELGEPAIPELEVVAEDGGLGPLADLLDGLPYLVRDVDTFLDLTPPGETRTLYVDASRRFNRISIAAMMIPSNDTFVAIDSIRVPKRGRRVVYALAYDAGTEFNDQLCANIPGPPCFGDGLSPTAADDEGFVHVANGFHELGPDALAPSTYDWRNPVARIVITRVPDKDDEDND